jgi:uncharacterized peroxidase-related enzyme
VKALGEPEVVDAVLADYKTAPIDARLGAMFAFLEKLTLAPDTVGPDDVAALRAAGISDEAAEQAIYVCFIFSVMTRLADTLDFRLNDARGLKWVQRILLGLGYNAGSIPGG